MEMKSPEIMKKRVGQFSIEEFNDIQKSKKKKNCPYLGTIKRHLLDFDFEKICSKTLAKNNIYCCLVCGKYLQGLVK